MKFLDVSSETQRDRTNLVNAIKTNIMASAGVSRKERSQGKRRKWDARGSKATNESERTN